MIVYTKNKCQRCRATETMLNRYKVDYTEYNVDEDPDAYERVQEIAKTEGFVSMPIVIMDNGDSWCGFNSDLIKKAAGV